MSALNRRMPEQLGPVVMGVVVVAWTLSLVGIWRHWSYGLSVGTAGVVVAGLMFIRWAARVPVEAAQVESDRTEIGGEAVEEEP